MSRRGAQAVVRRRVCAGAEQATTVGCPVGVLLAVCTRSNVWPRSNGSSVSPRTGGCAKFVGPVADRQPMVELREPEVIAGIVRSALPGPPFQQLAPEDMDISLLRGGTSK